MLRVFARRRGLNNRPTHTSWKPNPGSIDDRTCLFEPLDGAWVVANLDADLFQNGVGVDLEQLEVFIGNKFVGFDRTSKECFSLSI